MILRQQGYDATFLDNGRGDLVSRQLLIAFPERIDQFPESRQLLGCSRIDRHGIIRQGLQDCPQTHAIGRCSRDQFGYGGISYSTCRIINHPLEGLFIVRINHQPEIRNHILHLFSLVERQAAVNPVRNVPLAHGFFQDTRLGIGAIQDSHICIRHLAPHFMHAGSHGIGFFVVGIRGKNL